MVKKIFLYSLFDDYLSLLIDIVSWSVYILMFSIVSCLEFEGQLWKVSPSILGMDEVWAGHCVIREGYVGNNFSLVL